MISKEMKAQAKMLFAKTLFDYYERLEKVYLKDSNDFRAENSEDVSAVHRAAREKMVLINQAVKKYGMKEFDIPYFFDKEGNA